jgi:hypothetical protein
MDRNNSVGTALPSTLQAYFPLVSYLNLVMESEALRVATISPNEPELPSGATVNEGVVRARLDCFGNSGNNFTTSSPTFTFAVIRGLRILKSLIVIWLFAPLLLRLSG